MLLLSNYVKKTAFLKIDITTTTFYLFGENIYPCKKVEKSLKLNKKNFLLAKSEV